METNIKSIATNYGLYLGGLLALATVLAYAVNLDLLTKWWFGISLLLAIILFGIISIAKSKSAMNGMISFKEAFTSYFLTVVLGLAISTVVSILIFNFIDPEAAEVLKNKIMDSQVETMRNWGAPEESVAAAVKKFEEMDNMYSIGNILQSLAFQLIGFSIVGLICAAIMKRTDPDA